MVKGTKTGVDLTKTGFVVRGASMTGHAVKNILRSGSWPQKSSAKPGSPRVPLTLPVQLLVVYPPV